MKSKLFLLLVIVFTSCQNLEQNEECEVSSISNFCLVTYKSNLHQTEKYKVCESKRIYYLKDLNVWVAQDSLDLDRRCFGEITH